MNLLDWDFLAFICAVNFTTIWRVKAKRRRVAKMMKREASDES